MVTQHQLFNLSLEELIKLHEETTKELDRLIIPGKTMYDNYHKQQIVDTQTKLEIINSALSIKRNISKAQRVADRKLALSEKNTTDPNTKSILCDNMDCPNDAVITKGCIIKGYLIYINMCENHSQTFTDWLKDVRKALKQ